MRSFLTDKTFRFDSTDRFLQMFHLTFDLSIMSAFVPLSIGASCHLVSGSPLQITKVLAENKITVALMVPSVLFFLEKYFDEINLPDMRYSLFCGEALSLTAANGWRRCVQNARIFNVYGPTEATIFCTMYELPSDSHKTNCHNGVVSIGRPMSGTQMHILQNDSLATNPGELGELCLSGDQVTNQYWQDAEKTNQAFVRIEKGSSESLVYRTGDIGFRREGNFFFCGRKDQQIKIEGYRVELGEIEFHAKSAWGVGGVAVVISENEGRNSILHLFLESSEPLNPSRIAEYKSKLSNRLPSYMVPQKIHQITALPLNANGKIDRKKLLTMTYDPS